MGVPDDIQAMIRASAAASLHLPTRAWTCKACGEDWVCTVRQDDLKVEFDGRQGRLEAYLAVLHTAMVESGMAEAEADKRMYGWG